MQQYLIYFVLRDQYFCSTIYIDTIKPVAFKNQYRPPPNMHGIDARLSIMWVFRLDRRNKLRTSTQESVYRGNYMPLISVFR